MKPHGTGAWSTVRLSFAALLFFPAAAARLRTQGVTKFRGSFADQGNSADQSSGEFSQSEQGGDADTEEQNGAERGLIQDARVLITGLKSAVELNGMQGIIEGFDPRSGRYVVRPMGENSKLRRLRSQNLIPSEPTREERRKEALETFMQDTNQRVMALTRDNQGGRWPPGTRVEIEGLVKLQALNGHIGTIRTFDFGTHRYVVEFPGSPPRRIRGANLRPVDTEAASDTSGDANPAAGTSSVATLSSIGEASRAQVARPKPRTSICQSQAASRDGGPNGLLPGAKIVVQNLHSASALRDHLNGMSGVVHCFDTASRRYVVSFANGVPKRLRPENLVADVSAEENKTALTAANRSATKRAMALVLQKRRQQQRLQELAAAAPRLTVCNAYPARASLQVFAIRDGRSHRYMQVMKGVAFQDCADIRQFPFEEGGSLSFVVGRYQVGNFSVNMTRLGKTKGLGLVVHRSGVNSLKAAVQDYLFDSVDLLAYHLHVVSAYTGSRPVELHVQRGSYVQKLPFNSTYRLSREAEMRFTLTDGTQRLHMSLQPRRSRNYCVVLTGVDAGLRGEPRNVGLLAHEMGAWTAAQEEMPAPPAPPPPPPLALADTLHDEAAGDASEGRKILASPQSSAWRQRSTSMSYALLSWLLLQLVHRGFAALI